MVGFDQEKYLELQSRAIISRMRQFRGGKLYLEIGGKFLYDEHAERVLPGFDPLAKVKAILKSAKDFEILLCINSQDIESERVWKQGIDYEHSVLNLITNIKLFKLPRPKIVVNLYTPDSDKTNKFLVKLNYLGYEVYKRYCIKGYPEDLDAVVSAGGFGMDDYVQTNSNLVLVVGLGSNSGKLSTCLGQIYQDSFKGLESGYAKYELFPIWQLPPDHPTNLTYEAATADIGDYNMIDPFYKQITGKDATNYNRDIEAFPIFQKIIDKVVSKHNQMRAFKSPTHLGINTAGECLIDENRLTAAAIAEIEHRISSYKQMNLPIAASKSEKILAKIT